MLICNLHRENQASVAAALSCRNFVAVNTDLLRHKNRELLQSGRKNLQNRIFCTCPNFQHTLHANHGYVIANRHDTHPKAVVFFIDWSSVSGARGVEGEAWVDCQIFITGQELKNKSRDVLYFSCGQQIPYPNQA